MEGLRPPIGRCYLESQTLARLLPLLSTHSSFGRLDLAADVRGHHVGVALVQQALVERERLHDVIRRNAADSEADVVEDVIARRDGFIDEIEAGIALHAEKVDACDGPANFE